MDEQTLEDFEGDRDIIEDCCTKVDRGVLGFSSWSVGIFLGNSEVSRTRPIAVVRTSIDSLTSLAPLDSSYAIYYPTTIFYEVWYLAKDHEAAE